MRVGVPRNLHSKMMNLVQLFGLWCGYLIAWWRTTPGPPDNQWLQLPHCDNHGSADRIRASLTIRAISRYAVEICGASAEFRQGLQRLNSPPSPELLAALDGGSGREPSEFLGGIDAPAVSTPADYLKALSARLETVADQRMFGLSSTISGSQVAPLRSDAVSP